MMESVKNRLNMMTLVYTVLLVRCAPVAIPSGTKLRLLCW